MAKQKSDFTDRALLAALNELVAAEKHVACVGVTIRAMAKERGISVPPAEID